MLLKPWYQKLLLAWAILVVPGFILGWAYAGHAPGNLSVVLRLLVLAITLSPFVLAPFGITRKNVLILLGVVAAVAVCAWFFALENQAPSWVLSAIIMSAFFFTIGVVSAEMKKASQNARE